MKVFITGGCKNGKSSYAEEIALSLTDLNSQCFYLATMQPVDDEDNIRIAHHQASRRGLGFETIEWQTHIDQVVDHNKYNQNGTFLLDSVTALLANEMFTVVDGKYQINLDAPKKVVKEISNLIKMVNHIVIVSDFIYADEPFYDADTEIFRKGLGFIDCSCAKASDVVIEVCYGNLIVYKGEELMRGL